MSRFFNMWRKPEVKTPKTTNEGVSQLLVQCNEIFRLFLNNCSWFIYLMAGLLILFCMYYYFHDCKRRMEIRRRRRDVQRINDRLPQRRRPGAAYRDRQIFRNVIKTVRQYIDCNDRQQQHHCKSYDLKRTRSGAIYGRFPESENTTAG